MTLTTSQHRPPPERRPTPGAERAAVVAAGRGARGDLGRDPAPPPRDPRRRHRRRLRLRRRTPRRAQARPLRRDALDPHRHHATPRSASGRPTSVRARRCPEVFVGGEGLVLGAVDVLGTLLHEATHALAHVRGIQDTQRQGRYHNRRVPGPRRGDRPGRPRGPGHRLVRHPRPRRRPATDYADTLDALTAAITIHRRAEGALVAATPATRTTTAPPTGTTGGTTGDDAGPGRGTGPRPGAGAGAGSGSPPPSSRSARSPADCAASPSPPHCDATRSARPHEADSAGRPTVDDADGRRTGALPAALHRHRPPPRHRRPALRPQVPS